jgi:serine O-acetyltransferase
VVISTGAKVLGSLTVGDNVKIGAGSVVLRNVPANCTVVGVPGRVVVQDGRKIASMHGDSIDLRHNVLPDPVGETLLSLEQKVADLVRRIAELEEIIDESQGL